VHLPLEELQTWIEHFPTHNETAIDRLAASLFVNCRYPGSRTLASFTAYFDASGNALDQPFLIVAGYIANYLQWKNLESMWTQIHEKNKVDLPFHMAEFVAATQNPSRYASQTKARADYVALGNDPERAERFLAGLVLTQISSVNCSVTSIVPMSIYNDISSLLDLRQVIPPYALGARMCLGQVNQWEKMFDMHEPVECIFEEGDFEQGKFTDLMISAGAPLPIYKPKSKYAGLQAADMYAWERAAYEKHKTRLPDDPSPREAFNFLIGGVPTMHIQTTQSQLIHLCHINGIDPKTGVKHDKS
jgi:Protein of unknown function (DUF3800)